MKKIEVVKKILIVLMGIIIAFSMSGVNAATSDSEYEDILVGNNTSSSSNSASTNTNSNSTNTNSNTNNSTNNTNSNTNSNTNNTNTNNLSTNSLSSTNSNNNSSNNTNSNLPKTGIEDNIPTVALVVVFGISAVYALKKMREYGNI